MLRPKNTITHSCKLCRKAETGPTNLGVFLVEQQPHLLSLPGKGNAIYLHHLSTNTTVWEQSRKNERYINVSFVCIFPSSLLINTISFHFTLPEL